jgi:hypothetical protein
MAWVKVPAEHHPIFVDALPRDPRIERINMFGGIAAKVNGHFFAGLFGRSAMVQLPEPDRAEALALEGAGPFDPMGDGRVRSEKVMLPESIMADEEELRAWLARAFESALALPPKAEKPAKTKKATNATKKTNPPKTKTTQAKKATAKSPAKKRPAARASKPRARR